MYEKIKSGVSNNRFFVGLGICAIFFLPTICTATEPTYQIMELTTLEQNSTRLLANSWQLVAEL